MLTGYVRAFWLYMVDDPWRPGELDMRRGSTTRKLIADALRADRRENRGAQIVRRYSRDPVVDRRERRIEAMRQAAEKKLRLVV